MAHARRKHTHKHGTRQSGFRKRAVITEQFSKARLEHFRIMVLRGEYDPVIWHVKKESRGNLRYLEVLLQDESVGVAPNAADVITELVKGKVDIDRIVPTLEKTLENPYAKVNAATALAAHHLRRVNIRKLEGLLKHKDPEIKKAAEEVVSGESPQGPQTY